MKLWLKYIVILVAVAIIVAVYDILKTSGYSTIPAMIFGVVFLLIVLILIDKQ